MQGGDHSIVRFLGTIFLALRFAIIPPDANVVIVRAGNVELIAAVGGDSRGQYLAFVSFPPTQALILLADILRVPIGVPAVVNGAVFLLWQLDKARNSNWE